MGLALLRLGCAPSRPAAVPSGSTNEAAASSAPAAPAEPAPLPPLTPEEERLRVVLEKDVRSLTELGPRSLAHTWNLYSATDDLARRLELIGHSVGRQGFSVGDEVLQNLEVIL
ncbi:MAG TPA: hypothetical protein VG963_15705, partial [Polyangiaceae bacterium]|nr:hypothetical protein [Polyangiaceae bacterium]